MGKSPQRTTTVPVVTPRHSVRRRNSPTAVYASPYKVKTRVRTRSPSPGPSKLPSSSTSRPSPKRPRLAVNSSSRILAHSSSPGPSRISSSHQKPSNSVSVAQSAVLLIPDGVDGILKAKMSHFSTCSQKWGKVWFDLLSAWFQFEAKYKFGDACDIKTLGAKKRPAAIDRWIKNARKPLHYVMAHADLTAFIIDFWLWWSGLQNNRALDQDGVLVKDEMGLPKRQEGANWSKLSVAGLKGMLNVVAALYFWRESLQNWSDTEPTCREWTCAAQDVTWALQSMLQLD